VKPLLRTVVAQKLKSDIIQALFRDQVPSLYRFCEIGHGGWNAAIHCVHNGLFSQRATGKELQAASNALGDGVVVKIEANNQLIRVAIIVDQYGRSVRISGFLSDCGGVRTIASTASKKPVNFFTLCILPPCKLPVNEAPGRRREVSIGSQAGEDNL